MSQLIRYATMADVAKRAGVGKTSVSRYLNNEHHLLSEKISKKIEQAIDELNYQPNQMARGLKNGQARLIGLLLADMNNPFSTEILRGVEAQAMKYGSMVIVCNAYNSIEREFQFFHLFNKYRIDGLIINSPGVSGDLQKLLRQQTLPVVLLDRKIPDCRYPVISLNHQQAIKLIIDHLLAQKMDAMMFVSEPIQQISVRQERVNAFHQYLSNYPSIFNKDIQITIESSQHIQDDILEFIKQTPNQRRAIICASGLVTLYVANALKSLGIIFGKTIALVSFDNPDWAAIAGTGITCIEQPTVEMGRTAVNCLFDQIQQKPQGIREFIFNGRLIIRDSSTTHAEFP